MDASEIRALKTDLEKSTSTEKILTILGVLEKKVQPTEQLLRETKLGISVNKLRSHSDKQVSDTVKRIIKKWKDAVSAQKSGKKDKTGPTKSSTPSSTGTPDGAGAGGAADSNKPKFASHGKPRNPQNDGVKTDIYDDKTRNSTIGVIYTALAIDSEVPPNDILTVAKSVEKTVYEGEKGTTPQYRTKMRSLYMNLKDKSNPQLRIRVVTGEISPDRLYKMSPQEMASEELKEEMKKMAEQNLFNARGATEVRAVTDRFTCGKCKQKRVSYYQMQTRSADEPLTTFCTCENCGNRWKFS